MADLQLLDDALLDDLIARARRSPRRRLNHNFHRGPDDNPHRFLNALVRGTYVRPHRHVTPPKDESFLVLRGRVGVVVFDDEGRLAGHHALGGPGEPLGLDLRAGAWHALVALTEAAVIYEVKPGPWDPATDKDFADWAPPEGTPEAEAFLARLLKPFGGTAGC
ncbi:MAG: WbuC family cupin fold metalloprotein [Sandaracinaceae bacterium]